MTSPKLEELYIRSNGIDDEAMEKICANLKDSTIKSLDLSLNKFTNKSIGLLAETLKDNGSLECLGLAGLQMTISDFKPLLEEFGRFPLTPEEAEELKQRITERDAIVTKNKKAKGKKVMPVPVVPNMIQDDQGNSFVVKKEDFAYLNIGLNNLEDEASRDIDGILSRMPSKFSIGITNKLMAKETIKLLVDKYGERVVL